MATVPDNRIVKLLCEATTHLGGGVGVGGGGGLGGWRGGGRLKAHVRRISLTVVTTFFFFFKQAPLPEK